jgi:hypothetical protein
MVIKRHERKEKKKEEKRTIKRRIRVLFAFVCVRVFV